MIATTPFASFIGALALVSLTAASPSDHRPSRSLHLQRRAADVLPTEPGPGDVYRTGQQCTIQFNSGTAPRWNEMTIDLMTGANKDMSKITNVATNIDGTTLTSFDYTCPDVTPNAPVYFYQFTDKHGANPTWTTRFTIASASGDTVPAPNANQPDGGEAIPWGVGKLASGDSSSSSSSSNTSDSSASSSDSSSSPASTASSTSSGASSGNSSGTSSSNSNSNSSSNTTSSSSSGSSSQGSGASALTTVNALTGLIVFASALCALAA